MLPNPPPQPHWLFNIWHYHLLLKVYPKQYCQFWASKPLPHILNRRNFIFVHGFVDLTENGRKEMFYLTMHSTHFIYGYMASDICHDMVKDQSDSERGNPLPPHGLLFPINSNGSFICTIPDRIAHTTAFVTPVVEHWLEREIAQWVHPMKDRSDDPSHHERTVLPWSYISLL